MAKITRHDIDQHPELADFVDRRMDDCPFVGYPTGWFMAAWSEEVEPGEVKPYHYFGQDLVIWRSEAGKICVMDAYCLHMGGHLAVGPPGLEHQDGKVMGDTVMCPWHGWQWDAEGKNTHIPNSSTCNKYARLKVWHSQEIYGRFIMIWHDSLGREPFWDLPEIPELDKPDEYYLEPHQVATQVNKDVHYPLPMFVENFADGAHVKFVHGSEIATMEFYETDGPIWKSGVIVEYLSRKSRYANVGKIMAEGWGLGATINRLYGLHENVMIIGQIPTHGWNCDVRVVNFAKRAEGEPDPVGMAKRTIEKQLGAVDEDARVVAAARYNKQPAWVPEEVAGFRLVRKWTRQFYPYFKKRASTEPLAEAIAAE